MMEPKPEDTAARKDRALLVALGFDPDQHRLQPFQRRTGGRAGVLRLMRVLDLKGKPVRCFTEKHVCSDRVRKAWREAMRTMEAAA